MRIPREKVDWAVSKVREIEEQCDLYALHGGQRPIPLDLLHAICEQYVGKPISFEYANIPGEGSSILGTCIAFEDRYAIYVVTGLDPVMRRFVQVKELFHAVLDSEPYRRLDLQEHAEEVQFCYETEDSEPNDQTVIEQLAEFAAMEVLFPFEQRVQAAIDKADLATVAEQMQIPERFLELYMSGHAMAFFGPSFGYDVDEPEEEDE